MRRVGLYGGTFAPPHIGHVRAAEAFLSFAGLDRLYVMPTFIPPHKQILSCDDPERRLQMARAAFGGTDGRITVSDMEIRRGGVSYTADTLAALAAQESAALYFLCGTDMFLSMDTWRRPEEIFRLAVIVCVSRFAGEGQEETIREKASLYAARYGARTMLLPLEPLPLSSSEIREKIAAGEDVEALLPPAVARLIREWGLYHE